MKLKRKIIISILVIILAIMAIIFVYVLFFKSTNVFQSIKNKMAQNSNVAINTSYINNNYTSENKEDLKKENIQTSETINKDLTDTEETYKEIKIYDIEDGYLTVPYNYKASKHSYNWDKLNMNQKYYKYEDDNYTSKFGIDVSEFQGDIDWKRVKNAGVEFAFIRLGYRGYAGKGSLVLDSKFTKNINEAINNKINVGIYFFSQAINKPEAIQEAHYILDNIKGKNITYPICFDLEKIKFDTARTDNLSKEEITNISMAFCKEIEAAGYSCMIYGNAKTFTTRIHLEELENCKKWYADYQSSPLYPYEFDFWQYSEKGKVDGINTNVDLNLQFIFKK